MRGGNRRKRRLSVMFSLLIFLTLTATLFLSGCVNWLLAKGLGMERMSRGLIPLIVAAVSIALGTAISRFVGRRPLAEIAAISQAAKAVAKGDFTVRVGEDIAVDELRELAESFNRMTRELAGTELLRSDFVENVSHEFKTPLSAMEGYAALLQRPGLGEEKRREYTQKILQNTRRLSTLTSNILLLSRLEHQEFDLPTERFLLDEQLREVILSMEDKWTEKELELDIGLCSAVCQGNQELLAHVWQNILGNAMKFAPRGGIVRVTLQREGNAWQVAIADNGPGMTEEVRRRVFEKFYQGDSSRSSQGNGLGLALAKRIVDLHGGEIVVDSKEGRGARFTVLLPVTYS